MKNIAPVVKEKHHEEEHFTLYLVRHAQSKSNVGDISSSKDTEITKIGRVQAKRLAKYLVNNMKIDLILTSPYKRTIQTLEAIKEYGYKGEIVVEPLLRERSKGIYEGRPRIEFIKKLKELNIDEYSFRPQGEENCEDVHKRMEEFWEKLKRYYKKGYKHILIISHNFTITRLILVILNLPWDECYYFGVKNSSISWFKFSSSFKVIDYEINTLTHILKARE